jgi:hypothetical protein
MIPAGPLTLDDLERLAFTYGGTVERVAPGRYLLRGAVVAGQRRNFGPVRDDGVDALAAAVRGATA